jgi:threonine dehydratase
MIAVEDIQKARQTLDGVILKTPFAKAPLLSQKTDANIYLKKENLQLTGAYKIRGAYNKISNLGEDEKKRGVIAASAGNHAQGVAYSAKVFGIPSTIVMPETTPLLKVENTRNLGANIILHGSNYDEAYEYAQDQAKKESLTFIHPFADDDVIAGQGTIALEMLEELQELDIVVVPIGGGGLISGIGIALKALSPNTKIIGVVASGANAMKHSYEHGCPIDSKKVRTIADGIAVRDVNKKNLDTILQVVDEVIEVDDEEIANAILFLLEKQKLVVEGGGAVSIAALLHNKFQYNKDANIATVLSGGNIDVQMLSVIIEKGLIKSHKKLNLMITLLDKPGSLRRLTDILESLNANIIQIDYDRVSTTLSYGDAHVTLSLETKNLDHQLEIKRALENHNYQYKQIV